MGVMHSQRRRSVLKAVGAAGTIGLAGCMEGEVSGSTTLTWADHWPEQAVIANEGTRYFMDRVEEETDIEFEYLSGGELGGPTEYGELLRQGTIDIGPISPQYASDIFPLSQVGLLPGYTEDVDDHTGAFTSMLSYTDGGILYEEEWEPNDMLPLLPMGSTPMFPLLQGDPVESIDELEGQRIRSVGGVMDWALESLDATPVAMDAEEGYTALERGTLDGNAGVLDSIPVFSFDEVTDYIITNAGLTTFVWVDTMRLGAWEDLSSDDQDALNEIADETLDNYVAAQMEYDDGVLSDLEGELEHHELPSDAVEEWNDRTGTVSETWVDNFDDTDLAQEALSEFETAVDEAQ